MEEQLDLTGAEAAVSTQQDCVLVHRAELENLSENTQIFCLSFSAGRATAVTSHIGISICSLDQACVRVRYCTKQNHESLFL